MREDVERSDAKILLVDDNPANLLALEGILAPLGHVLVHAQSGREALRWLLNDEFALILLDVKMPEMDGFETARLVRARPSTRHIPIIFLSAISREREHVFRGYERGAVDYIVKPFEPHILRSKVEVFVELWRRGERIRWQEEALREREREAQARRAEHRFRDLIDVMPLCVWAATPRGRLTHCNRVFLNYVGRTMEECAVGGGFLDVHRDERDEVERTWAEATATGRAFEVQFRLRRAADGAYRWQLGRGAPNRDERGRVVGWIFTATDVDAEKRGEEMRQLLLARERQARGAAEEAIRAKDQFLATLSHELRTPLTVILGWAQLLRGGKLGMERLPRAVEVIERNAHAQAALVNDLLDVSRIVSGKLRLEVQPADPFAVVAAGIEAMRPAAEAKGVALSFQEESARAVFSCDPSRLQQVVWNLVSNAVKFTPEGGHVAVRAAMLDGALEIEVRDDGSGISPEFLPHLFERFSQATGPGSRRGLGLGLAIVRHLVELHGGTVDASSEGEGKGATFTVRLAAGAGAWERPAEAETAPPPPAAGIQGVHVLLVEDDRDAREFFASVLDDSGANVVTASNAEEALRAFEREPPQVLVCDLGLPGQDGCALLERVRALPPERGGDVPAAAITAYAAAEDRRRAIAAGFQRHIAKPFDPAELPALIAELAPAGTLPPAPADVRPA
jgi:PAS domain S-box-containing protein